MKSGTFTQLFIHLVFGPQLHCLLSKREERLEVFKFMSGTLNSMGHKSLAVNGMPDHVHVLFSLKPDVSVSETVKEVKRSSTRFIKRNKIIKDYSWQAGFGAFSYSRSQIDKVIKYMMNQEVHHGSRSFKSEYIELLDRFNVGYNSNYLFQFKD
ncbi:MAG: transposase [Bacteroidota bacterium]|nr:transposase [Bacteroidota bacterium]